MAGDDLSQPISITIFGASGQTGRLLVDQALRAGHQVTAVVRDRGRLPASHERLRVECADVFEVAAIEPLVAGRHAVVSALGPRSPRDQSHVMSAGIASVVKAMQAGDTRRLVLISAAPVPKHDPGDTPLLRMTVKPVLRAVFKGLYDDMALMEDHVRGSGLDWTIVRPPRLTNWPATGKYRTAVNRNLPGGHTLSRGDLAGEILRLLSDPEAVRTTVGVAH